jgi:ubiquinone/menaquinone biosynthesis C-methylase UbiE
MTNHPHPPHGAGKSSFDLIDPERLFPALHLKAGDAVLDLGCGEGRYTLPLASRVGREGMVYAADLREEGLATLNEKAREKGLANIRTLFADVSQPLPLAGGSVNLAFLATVLHDLAEAGQAEGALAEIARLVKPGGRLAVLEFKKMAGPPGPPLAIRLSPEEVAALLRPYGFTPEEIREFSPHIYLAMFTKTSPAQTS